MIISPCISICKTDPSTGYCYGCGRSNEEKRLWKLEETTDDWKKKISLKLKKGLLVGSLKVLRNLILIKSKMVCLFSRKI